MALHVYRYRRDKPFTNNKLTKAVGTAVTVTEAAGGSIYDLQADDSKLADLDEVMLSEGYTRTATDPVGTPSSQIREAGGTILTLGPIADGQSVARSGANLNGAAAAGFDSRDVIAFDHFVSGNFDTDEIAKHGWRYAGAGTGNDLQFTGEAGHPGIVRLIAGTVAAARSCIHLGDSGLENVLAGGTNPITFEALVSPRGTLASTSLEAHSFGLASGWTTAAFLLTDGIYIRFAPLLDTFWTLVCTNASISTTRAATTNAPALGTWDRVGFVYTPGGTPSVQLVVNGVNEGAPITTNIPAGVLGLGLRSDAILGPTAELWADYVLLKQVTNKET